MFPAQEEADRTVFVGNLEARVREEILYELFLQAGPLTKVTICKDREGKPKSFGFVCFKHPESVSYAIALLNGIRLYGRPINVQYRFGSSRSSEPANQSFESCVKINSHSYSFFIQSSVVGHFGCIHVLATVDNAAMNIEMKKSWADLLFPCSSFQLIMQLYLKNIFSFRKCHTRRRNELCVYLRDEHSMQKQQQMQRTPKRSMLRRKRRKPV
ncbi:splicing regulator RBM11 isoform X4 [Pteropus medius]|uniref:splicing regulator RBM11 isoform X4 n=1 Tax=Pteropus vampyrus TaxID=132908 RepID=UPI00196ABE84|nr:splicing regulator RBM11 isoform X4 [Pteropus giganteus]